MFSRKMEAVQAPPKSSEAAGTRSRDGETLGDGYAAGSDLDGSGENGLRVSINGKEDLGGGGGFGEVVETRVVESNVLSVECRFGNRNGIGVSGTGNDSEIDGVGSFLGMRGGVGEIGAVDGGGNGENVKEMDSVSGAEEVREAKAGVLGDSHVVLGVDPDTEVGTVESKDSPAMMEIEDGCDGGNVFFVGDFVWGKIKNHPWWPGQIYDPSNASESAAKHNQKGKHLVAFSDGSFAWCHSSQLKPFEDEFEEMFKQSNTKSFVSAVDNALNDIGKLVELEMTCPCVLEVNEAELSLPLAGNTGIKEGVSIPGRGSKCSIIEFEPAEFVAKLKNVARVASISHMLDLLMLESTLSAFYRAKGGYQLPAYYEPQQIPGLEDKMEEEMLDKESDSGAVEVPVQYPVEEDWLSSGGVIGYDESSTTGNPSFSARRDDGLHQRKQKSIAEIIARKGTGSNKLASKSGRKKRKASGEAGDGVGTLVPVQMMKEREVSELFATPGSTNISENNGSRSEKGTKKRGRKRKVDSISSVEGVTENGHVRTERRLDSKSKEQNEEVHRSRERRKSKYLSPPYTNPIKAPQKEDSEPESQQVASVPQTGKRMTKSTDHTMESPIVKCSGKVSHTNLSEQQGKKRDSLNGSKFDPMTFELTVTDMLSDIRSVALFAIHPEVKAIDRVAEFVHMFRSSTYHEGSNHQEYEWKQQELVERTKCLSSQKRRGRKRKSVNSKTGLWPKPLNDNGDIVPQSESGEKRKKKNKETAKPSKPKSGPAVSAASDSETKGESESTGCKSLFVTFGPGSSLPTKNELIALYEDFGKLNERETDMFYNNFCARVVFRRTSDAEKAFNRSQESSPFGTANVTFRLMNTSFASKTQSLNETQTPPSKASSKPNRRIKTATKSSASDASNGQEATQSQQNLIKEKLEMMTVMVEQSDGKMSPNLKSALGAELRGVLGIMKNMG